MAADAPAQKKEEDLVRAILRLASTNSASHLRRPRAPDASPLLLRHGVSRTRSSAFARSRAPRPSRVRFVRRVAQDMLEEDDEFEEFEQESWDVAAEDAEDQQLWQEGWDEDDTEGDFTQQLRAELAKHASS